MPLIISAGHLPTASSYILPQLRILNRDELDTPAYAGVSTVKELCRESRFTIPASRRSSPFALRMRQRPDWMAACVPEGPSEDVLVLLKAEVRERDEPRPRAIGGLQCRRVVDLDRTAGYRTQNRSQILNGERATHGIQLELELCERGQRHWCMHADVCEVVLRRCVTRMVAIVVGSPRNRSQSYECRHGAAGKVVQRFRQGFIIGDGRREDAAVGALPRGSDDL